MKILFISMQSVHAIRWIENLKDTSHELYWFDVLNSGKLDTLKTVYQFTNWKKRKVPHIKGEYYLSKKAPELFEKIIPYFEVSANEALKKIILEIQPDIVHSFEMQGCSYPILKTMQKFQNIKWIYSCWGNDIYHYRQFSSHLKKIKLVLQRVDFLHTDCYRDFLLAKQYGFLGIHVGVIPTGSGFYLNELNPLKITLNQRKVILVKGYEHHLGRGLNIVKALHTIKNDIQKYEIVIFGAHQSVIDYVNDNSLNFKVYNRHELSHQELLVLMGKSLIYIGNSISDGMPNTLLEAIVMGVFPIQSNPGGASGEIITDKINGLLINDSENIEEIKNLILLAISDIEKLYIAQKINEKIAIERLDYDVNRTKIFEMYEIISKCE